MCPDRGHLFVCDTIVFKSLFEFCGRVTWFVADGECTIKDLSFLGLDGAVPVTILY